MEQRFSSMLKSDNQFDEIQSTVNSDPQMTP